MLSTFCRNCGTYFKIIKGQAVANPQPEFDLYGLGYTPPPASKPSIREARERPDHVRRRSERMPGPADPSGTPSEPIAGPAPAPHPAPREISCPDCRHVHRIATRAASTLCPRCGSDISLRNYQINNDWSTPIQTRGDVLVTRHGCITGVAVLCHNLTIEGGFNGTVQCDGDFTIRRHIKVPGEIRCKRLIVEQRAEVEFASTVHADEVIIDGKVSGDIHCKGCLTLKKRATLRGDISIASLAIAEGASHQGMVRMS